jgi:Cu(I)/Ag(I) efflux system periplasmic protein CusF
MNRLVRIAGAAMLAATLAVVAATAQDAAINGEIKKIDESAGKVTLKHGPASALGMDEPMTMVYRVKDPAMLKQVKVGDKVKFEADVSADGIVVTKLQKSK